ncbi:hypothetical protein Anas_05875 [Armadillidium nasatum]|uniref:Uncharacterized protein n=1 Tax=Armadillidium nasatum TaxID=96803 RepID=A0A5N5TFH6_9CRUS|nr:hypothetical protein Anas_05875 [Armadillidium nasatum]
MNIYIQIFIVFAVLVVQRTCKNISKYYEETRLELPEEILALHPNSTIPESEFNESQYHTMGKRSLESELSRKETTKSEKINLEPEYFAHITYPTNSDSESPSNESELEEERSDFVSEETGTINSKHQSRGIKFYKTEDDLTESKINEIYQKEIEATRHMNDEKEKPVNLNKFWKKETETTRTLMLQNDKSEYFSSNIPSVNIGSIVLKDSEEQHEVKLSAKVIAALLDLGINPAQIKPGNPEIIEPQYNIHKEFLELIDKDVKTNIFPHMFVSTVFPVIKEYLTPHLLKAKCHDNSSRDVSPLQC